MITTITTLVGQVLAITAFSLVGIIIHRITRIEQSLACAIAGVIAGFAIVTFNFDTGIRANNIHDIVFYLILPVLIFEAAWNLHLKTLRQWLIPILVFATVGVLISGFVSAGLIFIGVGIESGFPWMAALLTGAILSATDPVAVSTQLKKLNAPESLTTLFEGESLFNDATAVVFFSIILALIIPNDAHHSTGINYFLLVFFGGLIVGAIIGLLGSSLVLFIQDSSASQFILVFIAFTSFYVAEHLLHVSGILAVMMTAIVIKMTLSEVEHTVARGITGTWNWLGLYFNSLLFMLMGLTLTFSMFKEMWLAMIIAIVATLVARTIAISTCSYVTKFIDPITKEWQILLIWGGLRGAIAIALVLSLPTELDYWWVIQSMVFGVVVFSMLVQSTTFPFILKRLKDK
ncbi:MAG: cation:proton antiporter [Gammaproteobacteria bacterium]